MSISFYNLQNRLALKRSNRESYSQILGEHAEQMCELVKCGSKKELRVTCVRIERLTDEWVHLATRNHRPDSEYSVTASALIHAFSDIMCDYILDQVDRRKMAELINAEAKFFGGISGGGSATTRNAWIDYTAAIINVADLAKSTESERFYQLCTQCIRCAQVLGNYLTK